jgi:basic membrane protein A
VRPVRMVRLAAVAAITALVLAGCGKDDNTGGGGNGTAQKKTLKVGLAYDVGGRGDKSFNDAAAAGLERVKKELNLKINELSARLDETDADKAQRLTLLADGGYNPIIAVGFAYGKALGTVAKAHPDIKFAIIDDASNTLPNVANLVFAEEQGSFLVGAAAALKSTTGKVGFVGGVDTPLLRKFQAGYAAGVKQVKPTATVLVKYLTQAPDFSGFNDPAKGKAAATGMYDGGADVVYAAAGGSGTGVFQAAQAAGKLAIGVDSDQYNTVKPESLRDVIMTSMLKRVDTAVFDFVKDVADDKFAAGEKRFDLKSDGVGYSTSGGKVDDIKSKLEDLKQQIIDGKITVPATP